MTEPLIPSLARVNSRDTAGAVSKLLSWANDVFRRAEAGINRWEFGSFTISGTEVSAVVTIANKQDAADYIVQTTVVAISGTPADLAHAIQSVLKEQQQFTATIKEAPGTGNSVTYDYSVMRG